MSDFSTYNLQIENKIANTSEIFYDAEFKRTEANNTIREIAEEYDIPDLIVRPAGGTISFTSGVATFPSDYFRMAKLWENDANGIELNEFEYIVPDEFDKLASTASYFWTEDYDTSTSTRRLYIKPTSKTSLQIRYVKSPTEMTDNSTDSGLPSAWDEAVAYGTAMRLFQAANRYDEAQEMERLYKKTKVSTYLRAKNQGGVKQNNRLKSMFERKSYLGNKSTIFTKS